MLVSPLRRSLPAALLVVLAGLVAPGAAPAAPFAEIASNVATERCLQGPASAPTGVVPVTLARCDSNPGQVYGARDGELRFGAADRCLALRRGKAPRPVLAAAPCSGEAAQRWDFGPHGEILRHRASGRCARPAARQIVLVACDGADPGQLWARHPAGTSDVTPPTVPGTPRVVATTCTGATLRWTGSTDAGGLAVYGVYARGTYVADGSVETREATATLDPGTYDLVVRAIDRAGNPSRPSAPVRVTVPPCPGPAPTPAAPAGTPTPAATPAAATPTPTR